MRWNEGFSIHVMCVVVVFIYHRRAAMSIKNTCCENLVWSIPVNTLPHCIRECRLLTVDIWSLILGLNSAPVVVSISSTSDWGRRLKQQACQKRDELLPFVWESHVFVCVCVYFFPIYRSKQILFYLVGSIVALRFTNLGASFCFSFFSHPTHFGHSVQNR